MGLLSVRRLVLGVAAALAGSLIAAGAATAAAPNLISGSQAKRHASAMFSLPGADDATIYFAARPDRATDGAFLEENVKHLDFFTLDEIQQGRWFDSDQLDPGSYYVMLRATDYDCFGSPNCMNGYSNMLKLTIPKPRQHYSGRVKVYRYLSRVSLGLNVRPLGEHLRYRVCWRLTTNRRRCARGTVRGFSWNGPATDVVAVRKRAMPQVTTFRWYVNGRPVASKRARVWRP